MNISINRAFGRNRPIKSIDGYVEMVHRKPFQLNHDRSILIEHSDEATWLCVMKHIKLLLLDRDPTIRICFRALHLGRYNSFLKHMRDLMIQWT